MLRLVSEEQNLVVLNKSIVIEIVCKLSFKYLLAEAYITVSYITGICDSPGSYSPLRNRSSSFFKS